MSLLYRLAYALGFTPWEKATDTHGHLIAPLLYREEAGCEPPYGPALDLGCGAGYWAVELARRGWDVTGIDSVAKALRRARARTRAAGVEVRFVRGDVTRLEDAGVGSGFRFVYDLGCFHGLGDEERAAAARSERRGPRGGLRGLEGGGRRPSGCGGASGTSARGRPAMLSPPPGGVSEGHVRVIRDRGQADPERAHSAQPGLNREREHAGT